MTPEHIVWWMYTLGSVTCILGGICILLGVLVLAIHLAWKAASNVYGIAWLWAAIAEHKKTHPIARWTGWGEQHDQ